MSIFGLLAVPGHPTITKLRVIGHQQQLIRMDFEEPFKNINDDYLFRIYQRELERADIVVLSDYAKGSLHHSARLIEMARLKGVPVLVDPENQRFDCYQAPA